MDRFEDDRVALTSEGRLTQESEAKLRAKDEATDARRRKWRERTLTVAFVCLVLGGIAATGWWSQGNENQDQPLSISFHGEQALAVIGISLIIFGLGVVIGRHVPGEARRQRNGTYR